MSKLYEKLYTFFVRFVNTELIMSVLKVVYSEYNGLGDGSPRFHSYYVILINEYQFV